MARLFSNTTGVLLVSAVLLTACGGGQQQGQMPAPQVDVATPLVERVADEGTPVRGAWHAAADVAWRRHGRGRGGGASAC